MAPGRQMARVGLCALFLVVLIGLVLGTPATAQPSDSLQSVELELADNDSASLDTSGQLLTIATTTTGAVDQSHSTAQTGSTPESHTQGHGASSLEGAKVASTSTVASAADSLELTQELRLVPERKGIYEAHHQYAVPDRVELLEVTVPEAATIQQTHGFIQNHDGTWSWDGQTVTPELTYRLPANRTVDQEGPIAGPGRFLYVDVGDWAVVAQPRVSHRLGWRGQDVDFAQSTTAREGATSDVLAFLGPHEKYTHEAHGQEFQLIVPDAADLAVDREELFTSLSAASDRLRVGDRDDTVFMIAAPTHRIDWGVRGLATGPADMWVRDLEQLADPNNIWLHEYVHTRQDYRPASDIRWTLEGKATYYAALLSYEQGHISYDQFRNRLAGGKQSQFDSSVLADPSSWHQAADYQVGSLVTGALDREIRLLGASNTSFDQVFRLMNLHKGTLTAGDFQELLAEVGDSNVAALGEEYTQTTQRPDTWSEQEHTAAFGGDDVARVTFSIAEHPDAISVSSEYRDRALTAPIELVPGETLSLTISAENFGEQAGAFRAPLVVNGVEVAAREGTLGPGESTELGFNHTFQETGVYQLAVGDATVDVTVTEPAEPVVTDLHVDRTNLSVGEEAAVTVDVGNQATYPATGEVTLTRNGVDVEKKAVGLDARDSITLAFAVPMDSAGTHLFGVAGWAGDGVLVSVVEEPNGEADDGEIDDGDGDPTDDDPADIGDADDGDGETDGDEAADTEEDTPIADDITDDPPTEGAADDALGFGTIVGFASVAIALAVVVILAIAAQRRREPEGVDADTDHSTE